MENKETINRVTKITWELMDGTTESHTIGEDDSAICIVISEEQNINRHLGYSGDVSVTGLVLLSQLLEAAKELELAARFDRWIKNRKN